jgi:hypothetical protein
VQRIVRRMAQAAVLIGALAVWGPGPSARAAEAQDEAILVGRQAESFPAASEDYFHDVDGGHDLQAGEIKGRNMWLVWTGGNDRFWDVLTKNSFGTFDLLKTISSAPGLKFSRDNRWEYFGVVNEPCFEKATGPDPNRFGLWLDRRQANCAGGRDPFADEKKYPGVKIGARGQGTIPIGSYYGEPTGIVGLRLFPNPDFDEEARKKWDAKRFYKDPSYYQSKDLVRPYRVGMACGFCHIGPSPINPPDNPDAPAWKNLNSTVGSQYFWFDRVFVWGADKTNYIFQLLHAYRPGTLDTSLVSSDSIVNPRTMNAIYNLKDRLDQARRHGEEMLTGGQLNNKQFNDFVDSGPLTDFYQKPEVWTPRVLKDGSDSVGALGALNRVYINIGLFSEEWLLHFNVFTGGKRISPIEIATAEKSSVYWRATEAQTIYMAQFLLAAGKPDRLTDAPDGKHYLTTDQAVLDEGKTVFAERCARCHSSKLPEPVQGISSPETAPCNGPNYLACWNRYWNWTKTGDFKSKMLAIVKSPDFLQDNYLSSEFRVPLTLLKTNACSPLATNAIAGNIWDNFSSQSYKDLPSVGEVQVQDPFTGASHPYQMPAGGRGYTRPPSLISLWSTAPFLLNNSVGEFNANPSVAARMQSFRNGIEQMLWPETRTRDSVLGDKGVGVIDRTTDTSYLSVPVGYMPDVLVALRKPLGWLFPGFFNPDGGLKIGPIPKGTPVGLLGNLNIISEQTDWRSQISMTLKVLSAAFRAKRDLAALPPDASDAVATQVFTPLAQQLYGLSKCPDYVVNKGHYFGTDMFDEEPGLKDQEKRALIEFLKTL